MLFSIYLLSLCLPAIPSSLDTINQEEARLFSKLVKDQCWQKVRAINDSLLTVTFSSQLFLEEIRKGGDLMQ